MEEAFKNSHLYFSNLDMRSMLFESLVQPRRLYPGAKPTFVHIVTCMQVCKAWWKHGVGLVWGNIENYQLSLGLILDRLAPGERPIMYNNELSWKDKYLQVLSHSYPRYKLYAGYTRSLRDFPAFSERDIAFCEVIGLLNLPGILFPNLSRLELSYTLTDHSPSFPPQFRTGMITHLTVNAIASRHGRTQVENFLNEVAEYRPLLEELNFNNLIKLDYITREFAPNITPNLHSLFITIDARDYEKLMTLALTRAGVMTSIKVVIEGNNFRPIDHSSQSLLNLRSIMIKCRRALSCVSDIILALPAAPVLQVFKVFITAPKSNLQQVEDAVISSAVTYWSKARFADLNISTDSQTKSLDVEMNASPLLLLHNLTEFRLKTRSRVLSMDRFEAILPTWQQLRTLALEFGQPWIDDHLTPRLRLQDALFLARSLPNLETLDVTAEAREKLNPHLLYKDPEEGNRKAASSSDLTRFASSSLRVFIPSCVTIPRSPAFITRVIKQTMLSLEAAILRLGINPKEALAPPWQKAMASIGFSLEKDQYVKYSQFGTEESER